MNYYLWIDGQEEGAYTAEYIRDEVALGTVTCDQPARTEDSSDWKPLSTIMNLHADKALPPSAPARPRPTDSGRQSRTSELVRRRFADVMSYLRHIRANSCYRTLRTVVEVCFIISAATIFVAVGLVAFADVGTGVYWRVWGASLLAIPGFFLLMGFRQFALMWVDIADTLLHDHAQKAQEGQ